MPPSKITQFFKKVPSKDLDAEKETSGGNSTRDSTTLPSVSHSTSKAEVSRPRSPAPPRPHDKSNAAQAIFIESDTSEDESNLNQGAKPRHQKNANRSKTIILDDDTDSETTMKNLSIRSPQKRRRLILDDEDDEVASASDIGTSTKTAEETQNNSSHGDDQVTESEGEGCSA
ncbi:hypothetical protein BC943DRAFT_324735 [Umbelopsis sp. AD052]|nr:hypothetical protein BC943DRAFT_324735 [Umbelopsis sp. AD052]